MTQAEALAIIKARFPLVVGGSAANRDAMINALAAYVLASAPVSKQTPFLAILFPWA